MNINKIEKKDGPRGCEKAAEGKDEVMRCMFQGRLESAGISENDCNYFENNRHILCNTWLFYKRRSPDISKYLVLSFTRKRILSDTKIDVSHISVAS